MGLTPLDIHNKEFKKILFRGYDPDTVDEFLDQVIREFEVLIKENNAMRDQLEVSNSRMDIYRNQEEAINQVLVVAQQTAEELKTNARREADLIIQEARLQAERIIETGQVKARRVMEENADLVRMGQVLRVQMRSLLQAQLETLDAALHQVEGFNQAVQGIREVAVTRLPSTQEPQPRQPFADVDNEGNT